MCCRIHTNREPRLKTIDKSKDFTVTKILPNHISGKGLLSSIYKDTTQQQKDTDNPIFKRRAQELNKQFSKEDKHMQDHITRP